MRPIGTRGSFDVWEKIDSQAVSECSKGHVANCIDDMRCDILKLTAYVGQLEEALKGAKVISDTTGKIINGRDRAIAQLDADKVELLEALRNCADQLGSVKSRTGAEKEARILIAEHGAP